MSKDDPIWVCKPDGSIQCHDVPTTSLDEAHAQLAELIGAERILAQEKRHTIVIRVCGAPTGAINALQITAEGYDRLMTGFPGPMGFSRCLDDPCCGVDNSDSVIDLRIKELIGRPVRCYTEGDGLTDDFRPERVNVERDRDDGTIKRIWFG